MTKSKRTTFTRDESKYPWLTILLDTYHISDSLMSDYLEQKKKRGINVACRKGCYACCQNPTAPFTKLELMGISWYASEKLKNPNRTMVKQRLYNHRSTAECPFLVADECSIYPMRPIICRQFYVKGKPCQTGEDIIHTRLQDIILLDKAIARATAMRLLDYFGFKRKLEKEKAFNKGFIMDHACPMHEYDWSQIAKIMEIFDEKT